MQPPWIHTASLWVIPAQRAAISHFIVIPINYLAFIENVNNKVLKIKWMISEIENGVCSMLSIAAKLAAKTPYRTTTFPRPFSVHRTM
jgi:hypothetical protein